MDQWLIQAPHQLAETPGENQALVYRHCHGLRRSFTAPFGEPVSLASPALGLCYCMGGAQDLLLWLGLGAGRAGEALAEAGPHSPSDMLRGSL